MPSGGKRPGAGRRPKWTFRKRLEVAKSVYYFKMVLGCSTKEAIAHLKEKGLLKNGFDSDGRCTVEKQIRLRFSDLDSPGRTRKYSDLFTDEYYSGIVTVTPMLKEPF